MARKRMIDPSIWTDEGMAALNPRQQLLFIGLFSNADDEGRLRASPQALRLMMPTIYQDCANPDQEITEDLSAIGAQIRQLVRYEVGGRGYLAFRQYERWQRIDRPSKSALPAPPEAPDEAAFEDTSANERRTVPERSMSLLSKEKLVEEKVEKVRGTEGVYASADAAGAAAPLAATEPKPKRTQSRKVDPFLTDVDREKLHAEFDSVLGSREVDEVIAMALAHEAARKYRDSWFLYVRRTWLVREVQKVEQNRGATQNGTYRGTTNANSGRSLAGAGAGTARGQNTPIDASARDPREVAKLRELGQL